MTRTQQRYKITMSIIKHRELRLKTLPKKSFKYQELCALNKRDMTELLRVDVLSK